MNYKLLSFTSSCIALVSLHTEQLQTNSKPFLHFYILIIVLPRRYVSAMINNNRTKTSTNTYKNKMSSLDNITDLLCNIAAPICCKWYIFYIYEGYSCIVQESAYQLGNRGRKRWYQQNKSLNLFCNEPPGCGYIIW